MLKQPTELLATLYGNQSQTRSDDSGAKRVWASLAATFGERFLREFGDEPSAEWSGAVAQLSDVQITNRLRNLAEEGRAHPPNLSEFVKACRKAERPTTISTPPKLLAYHTGVSAMCRTGLMRIEGGHPEFRGYICCPFSLPDRPSGKSLMDWLKSGAPAEAKDYCRAGVEWSRRNRGIALPGFVRLITSIERAPG